MKAATDLAEALLAAASPAPIASYPFVARLVSGEASRESVKSYAIDLAVLAELFPRRIASVLSICDEPEVRGSLITNLLEEEGVVSFRYGAGIDRQPERSHGAIARRFARAAGATDEELHGSASLDSGWFASSIRNGDWIGAFAYFAVGFEANVPDTFALLVPALMTHYGFESGDLEFLTEHLVADVRHGQQAARLIARVAATEAQRERAMEGARRGGTAWYTFHRAKVRERAGASWPN